MLIQEIVHDGSAEGIWIDLRNERLELAGSVLDLNSPKEGLCRRSRLWLSNAACPAALGILQALWRLLPPSVLLPPFVLL